MQSSATPRSHVLMFLYSSLSTLALINVSLFYFILLFFFTPFRVLTDIHNPLVSRCVILITKLIFLIYVLG